MSAPMLLEAFPQAEAVFVNSVDRYAKHLHPLLSIDLSMVGLKGRVHLLSPIEPCDGYLGDGTTPYHTGYLRPNWIALGLSESDRYELLGDFRFFLLENPPDIEPHKGARRELEAFYHQQNASFSAARDRYKRLGALYRKPRNLEVTEADRRPLVSQIGGRAPGGNWTGQEGLDRSRPDDIVPLTKDGRRFKFIACTPGWQYRDFGADQILLFFDDQTRTALFTFDWG